MRDKRCELGAHYGCSCDDRELVENRLEVERLRAAIREVIRTADMPTEPGWHVTWPELEHARALTKPEGE